MTLTITEYKNGNMGMHLTIPFLNRHSSETLKCKYVITNSTLKPHSNRGVIRKNQLTKYWHL